MALGLLNVMSAELVCLGAHVPILGLQSGALDELDFWAGTFGVTLFALVETILFIWLFTPERAWEEIHRGAQARIPRLFLWVLKYVTPLYLPVEWGAAKRDTAVPCSQHARCREMRQPVSANATVLGNP